LDRRTPRTFGRSAARSSSSSPVDLLLPKSTTGCQVRKAASFPIFGSKFKKLIRLLLLLVVMYRIVAGGPPPIPEGSSPELQSFLAECFHKDPAMRPSAELLFEHEWLRPHLGFREVRSSVFSLSYLHRSSPRALPLRSSDRKTASPSSVESALFTNPNPRSPSLNRCRPHPNVNRFLPLIESSRTPRNATARLTRSSVEGARSRSLLAVRRSAMGPNRRLRSRCYTFDRVRQPRLTLG
jgi:serine/threonine protein kinase